MTTQQLRVGFVGVGAISAAIVTALTTGPHAGELHVVLSPRSAERSRQLAEQHEQVSVAAGNQDVVDASDIVFIGVLPGQVEEVCSALTFRAEQIVVGVAAGWPPSRLAPLVAPAATICQVIPLPMITAGVGPVVVCPGTAQVERLLAGCGTLIVVEQEEQVGVFSCTSAIMSTFFAFQNAAIDWACSHGIDRAVATAYVTAELHGLTVESIGAPAALADAVREHETPGGLNEHVRASLEEQGFFTELGKHLETIWATRIEPADG